MLWRVCVGPINNSIFEGVTINTPSMLAVEDCLDALKWVGHIGGLPASIRRVEINYAVIEDWISNSDWAAFFAEKEETRSTTSVCLKITSDWFVALSDTEKTSFIKSID